MSVRIRMKRMGRRHRPFYRICAIDRRAPRDGRVLEELGTYDPCVGDTDARAVLNGGRIDYWLGVGAQPSVNVAALIKKYGTNGTHVEAQKAALEKLAQPKQVPDPGPPASSAKPAKKKEAKADAAATETAKEETAAEEPATQEQSNGEAPDEQQTEQSAAEEETPAEA